MGIFDFFKRSNEDNNITSTAYTVRKAYSSDAVDGEVIHYDLRRINSKKGIVDRFFIIEENKKRTRSVFCFSPAEYNNLRENIKGLKDDEYLNLLKHHKDNDEERGLIVRIEKSDKNNKYKMTLLGEVIRTKTN